MSGIPDRSHDHSDQPQVLNEHEKHLNRIIKKHWLKSYPHSLQNCRSYYTTYPSCKFSVLSFQKTQVASVVTDISHIASPTFVTLLIGSWRTSCVLVCSHDIWFQSLQVGGRNQVCHKPYEVMDP